MSNPTPGERWEQGIDHDPRSEKLVRAMAKIDFEQCDDSLQINVGGDGDNGEHMMYLLDCHFAEEAAKPKPGEVDDMTSFEALDHVKALRAGYNACNGALYKNVAVDLVQSFLEKCIAKWGQPFMECVERELHEERFGADDAARFLKDKGRRDLVFGQP